MDLFIDAFAEAISKHLAPIATTVDGETYVSGKIDSRAIARSLIDPADDELSLRFHNLRYTGLRLHAIVLICQMTVPFRERFELLQRLVDDIERLQDSETT